MKKESRILVLSRIDSSLIAIVLRGIAGIEHVLLVDSCNDILDLIVRGKSFGGEIKYLLDVDGVCPEIAKMLVPIDEKSLEIYRDSIENAFRIIEELRLRLSILVHSPKS